MKAFLILSTMAAAASAKVASSVLRALEVDGNADVFVRFADASSALEAATIESNKPLERQEVFEILSDATATGQKSIEAATAGFEVTPTWIVSGAFIKAADKALIEKLTLNRAIKSVEQVPDMELDPVLSKSNTDTITAPAASPNQWGVDTVGAPAIWKYTNGSGIVIGSIDTGARHTHLLLKDSWRSDRGWYDPYNRTAVPEDLGGHGTHTIGTMTGNRGYGVAPGAQWIACRGLYVKSGSAKALLECLQFMICPTRTDGTHPDCSKGADTFHPVYEEAIASIRKAGITPIFANGNEGPACGTTGSPGTYPNVISVGAIGSYSNEPNKLAFFSSKGPGNDTGLAYLAGTSMAAPHVAGVVALLKSIKRDLTYDEIYAYLTQTADRALEGEPKEWLVPNATSNGTDVYPGAPNCGGVDDTKWPNNRYGYGRVNVAKILDGGKFASVATPTPVPRTTPPAPIETNFCTYKKTALSEWNQGLYIDTIKGNKNEGFTIDRVSNVIAAYAPPKEDSYCLALTKDATNTNTATLTKCKGDETQIWNVAPCSPGAVSQYFDACDNVKEKSYVKLITKTNKVISEFYSGVYADWVSDSVNELFVYDSNAKTLQAASNGQCLDAFRDGDKFGLHTYACDATNGNQKWIIDAANHKIKHATHNNLCLDVDPTNPSHAAQVWECHNANTNQWIDAVKY
ncbi:hypothetical protein SPRG_11131 [Saprolegnia parasitica CBS 223.65]|uniref:subtilisin n=1 Tax=Saprolegnia parasitica (strain CBS 223.65) TaxID=695850 RepID=A0A067BZL0_SAPPC|nr:hypothetical protein SPRG_11131 [Saprolegnia parasitica CBS 223.65]KDO23683.1 hypothetical protein SPRG_11131 [Saprolegnia parasitica CBS 223.65]|eukprot:XP_012205666.1 hypothetical protein SPRG_11131 [Saprolegnia parasitica CBS 223.65]